MGYLVCYNCDVYYEIENEIDAEAFKHCDCGYELVYFENLEDSYQESTDPESGEAYPDEPLPEPVRQGMANGSTFTEKKASEFQNYQNTGKFLIFSGIGIIIIGLLAGIIINFLLFLLVILGGFLVMYGNSMDATGKQKGYSWQKGLQGENIVLEYLNTLPQNYFVYHDVKLPGKGGNIDHVVIGPTGIFVIETKNYSGRYRIKQNQWFYYKKGQYMEIKRNPGVQVKRNTMDLINFLNQRGISTKGFWINSIVALICSDFRVIQTPAHYKVILPKTLPEYILNQKKVKNVDLIKEIALELEPYCVELTFVK